MAYVCKDSETGKVECVECVHFMWGADCCMENSVITPAYRMLHPESKPMTFKPSGYKKGSMKLIYINTNCKDEKK